MMNEEGVEKIDASKASNCSGVAVSMNDDVAALVKARALAIGDDSGVAGLV